MIDQRRFHRGTVAGKIKIRGRILNPIEVQLKQRVAAVPQHRLDQRKLVGLADDRRGFADGTRRSMCGAREKLRLQQALAKFLGRIGINDYAAAGTHASARAIKFKSTDGYVEDRLARREKSDSAGVDAARRVFKLGDKLHGPDLGRACHRSTGKQRAENFMETYFGPQFGTDGRSHLPKSWQPIHGKEL